MDRVGSTVELDVGPVAHGGHCVARWDGLVVFVRHSLPGERVRATITEQTSRFLRADAVEILVAAPGRTPSRCPESGPGGCGGCDFQHVELGTQRRLLAEVVAEQLRRLAGLERAVTVEAVPVGTDTEREDGLGWRTRVTFSADADGRLGLRRHRSHEVAPLTDCPIAHRRACDVLSQRWPGTQVRVAVASGGERLVDVEDVRGPLPDLDADGVLADGQRVRGRTYVRETVHGRRFKVSGSGFWQVHPRAATTLVDAVLAMASVRPGESAADLYAGVGLFSAFLGDAVGPQGSVVSVEADARASRDARRNLHDLAQVRLVNAPVDRALRERALESRWDVVVLDPPRTGARRRVVRGICERQPSRVVYVACDPAAFARDVATFASHGYGLTRLRAFDLFPMTQHVECVGLLEPTP